MKILICTGIYPPDIGGPAKYAKNLAEEFLSRGYNVKVLAYGLEKKLPTGFRHYFYFFRTVFSLWKNDLIICLDMFSTGFPAILAGEIFRKKTILRIGGDFLWETYVEKTGNMIGIKDFYKKKPCLSLKFKTIAFLQRFALKNSSALAFNSDWQKEFFEKVYGLDPKKNFVVENFYPAKSGGDGAKEKNFLFAGRKIKFKNLKILEEVFEELEKEGSAGKLEIIDNLSQKELQEKIKNSYALAVVSISDFVPNFIIEGLSADKPFILTKECGLADKLAGMGVFIDPFDKQDIKRAVLLLMNNDDYNKYKQKITGFNFTHSWQEIADEILDIYKKMPARGGSAFGGKVLMLSTDKSILDKNSEARQRMVEYGKLAEKLRVIILSRPLQSLKIGKDIKGFDLVTTQDPFECGLIGYAIAKKFKARLQLQIHTDFLSPYFVQHSMLHKIRVKIARFLIPRADCIRVVSERIKSSLLSTFHILPSKILILPIFVDTEKIKNSLIKTDLHQKYPQFDFIILMASRLTKEKNIGLAIEALHNAKTAKSYANNTKVGLIIVGDGPEEKNLKSQISNLKINENIIIENWTNDLTSYYKTADLFLLTSSYEGYGRTLVEAAAAGCKIISSNVGIAAEILPKENIFEVNNKKQLKEKIIEAIKGEIVMLDTKYLTKMPSKEKYLEAYKKSWEICGF